MNAPLDEAPYPGERLALGPFRFDNSYARLPERFYARILPTRVADPNLIGVNLGLARLMRVDAVALQTQEGVAMLAGNLVPPGAEPIAMAYAGHQFGGWSPQLGDGRAILLGEVVGEDGVRRDIQLKGSGPTPYSRRGDGRAALGPVLREFIVSEAMAALGVPTTRTLAAVTTGEQVYRETALPGAVLTRVAESHVRIGTFEYFANRGDVEATRILADYVIARHYPDAASAENPYGALLDSVIGRIAGLIARWQLVGFIHGVMNTDNMSVVGETIDYGPCAFMDQYHPGRVYSSIDRDGRYAYGNQPRIAHWNLTRFAGALLPLLDADEDRAVEAAQTALDQFPAKFLAAYREGMAAKIGLASLDDDDMELAQDLLSRMAENEADFTLAFRGLVDAAAGPDGGQGVRTLFRDPAAFDGWAERWRARLERETVDPAARRARMRAADPAYIPRNHRIEAVIRAAVDQGDLKPFQELMQVLARPYEDQPEFARYRAPPRPEEIVRQTFCGT